MAQHLLGVAEIAAMLGLTRQRVNQLIQAADFPAPEADLSAGRIWSREAVETWLAAHPDRWTEAGTATFANFTDAARAVVVRAQEEARRLRHSYIGTEHVLLALLSGAAPAVKRELASLGADRDGIAADIEATVAPGDIAPTGHIPFTPRAKNILVRAAVGADGPVEPRHLMQAVVRSADSVAVAVMRERTHLSQDELAAEVDRRLAGTSPPALFTDASPETGSLRCSFCGKDHTQVRKLIAGPGIHICDECLDLCNKIIEEESPPGRSELAARIEALAAELDVLRRHLGTDT